MDKIINSKIIIDRKAPNKIISFTLIITLLLIIVLLYIHLFKYQTYYQISSTIKKIDNEYYLLLYPKIEDLNIIVNNKMLEYDYNFYQYKIKEIKEEIVTDNINNYKEVIISINLKEKDKINNYLINIKIKKENKLIIKHIIDYFRKE